MAAAGVLLERGIGFVREAEESGHQGTSTLLILLSHDAAGIRPLVPLLLGLCPTAGGSVG